MRFWGKSWGRYSGFSAVGPATPDLLEMIRRDFAIANCDAFRFKHFFLLGKTAGVASEFSIRSDDAMTRDGRSVGIFVEGVTDGTIALGAMLAGDVGVGEHPALGNSCRQGPDF